MRNPYKTILATKGLPYKTILGESSAKTVKGESIGYLTGIVYLVPDEILCPLANKAQRIGLIPLVRPNGTSDIPFENIVVHEGKTIFQLFPDVQFYDYTKHPSRKLEGKTAGNYDLTYSFSAITPKPISIKGLTNPNNSRTAVVFQKQSDIPSSFRGWPVIDGDNTDVRHIEPKAVVVALYAKGKAKSDTGGFVQIKGVHYA